LRRGRMGPAGICCRYDLWGGQALYRGGGIAVGLAAAGVPADRVMRKGILSSVPACCGVAAGGRQ
jgi:hypothetical protein